MINSITYLYPNAIVNEDFTLQDDGQGAFISFWNTDKLGVQPTSTALSNAEVEATLAITKANQKSLIETAYQTAITASIAYMSTTFQADAASQDILVKVLLGMQVVGATPSGFAWLDANNVPVPMALADLQGLYGAILTRGQVEFAKRLIAKNAINVASTIAEVEAVVL